VDTSMLLAVIFGLGFISFFGMMYWRYRQTVSSGVLSKEELQAYKSKLKFVVPALVFLIPFTVYQVNFRDNKAFGDALLSLFFVVAVIVVINLLAQVYFQNRERK